jgi:cytochrome c oxidase accessory protein FixG
LIVTYDEKRGEPRGARSRHVALADTGLGACVDCDLCVHVCPTGIDIRHGLQYECIGCAACVDVCDGVMSKMGYDKGLIRYATQNAMDKGWSTTAMWKRIFRPRVLIYTGVLWTLILVLGFSLYLRMPMKVDVIRDRGMPRITQQGEVENVYRLQIMNATEEKQGLHIQARGLDGMSLVANDELQVEAAQSRWLPVKVGVPYENLQPGSYPIWFDVSNDDGSLHVTEKAVFLVPR